MPLLLAALLLAPMQQGCLPADAAFDVEAEPAPRQKSGPGLWIGGLAFGEADIAEATEAQDVLTDEWVLHIRLTDAGRAKFREAQRCGVNFPIEVSLDGKTISRPILREHITGSEMQIAGGFTEDSAAALAERLAPGRSVEP